MVVDDSIHYLLHYYPVEVLIFFDPEAVMEKEDWYWDPEKKVIVNPLSKSMDTLKTADGDYSFVDTTGEREDAQQNLPQTIETDIEKTSPKELAMDNMNLDLAGQCDDSVSTLGNPLKSSPGYEKGGAGMITGMIGVHIAPSGNSVSSSATMESRVTAMGLTLDDTEKSIVDSIQSTLKNLLQTKEPPGGEISGDPNG